TVSQALVDAVEMGATTVTAASLKANPAQTTASEVVPGDDTETPVVTGSLTVALSANTPSGSSPLITTQSLGELAKFTFKASSDTDLKVTKVKLKRLGVSADATLSSIYLYDGVNRLTDSATVSSGYITWNTPSGIFTVPAGTTKVITVYSNILTGTAGQTVGVGIEAVADITSSNGTVGGSFPINGNTMSIASAVLATADFAVPTPTSDGAPSPQDDFKLWESVVTIGTRAVNLEYLTLRQVGSINSADLSEFELYLDGILISSTASLNSEGYVTFDLTGAPVKMESGSRTLKVLVNIVGGSTRTTSLSVRQATDVKLVDSQYNVPVLATYVAATFSNVASVAQTIAAGSLNITKMADSPSGSIVNGGSQQTLAKYELKASGESIKVENLRINYAASDSEIKELRNGALFYNGVQVGSTADIQEDSYDTTYTEFSLGSSVIVVPGTPGILEIKADIYDGEGTTNHVGAGDTIQVSIAIGSSNLQKMTSLTFFSNAVEAANTLTVATGSMTLSKDQAYGNQTVVVPQNAYKLAQYSYTIDSTEAVTLNTIQVNLAGTVTPATDLTDLYVVYGDKETAIKGVVAASNSWSVSKELAAKENITVTVYADLGSVISNGETVITSVLLTGTTKSGTVVYTNSNSVLAGQTITAATAGTLAVSLDNTNPLAAQIAAGSVQADGALKVKMTATNEDLYAKTVTFRVNTSANDSAIISVALFAKEGSGEYAEVGTAKTLNIDGDNPGYVTWELSGADRVKIAKNSSSYLLAKPTYVSSGQAAVSGLTPKLMLTDLEAEGSSNLTASGTSTGTLINSAGIMLHANSTAVGGRSFVDSTETQTAAIVGATSTTLPTADGVVFLPGDIIFVDNDGGSDWDPATEELMVVLADGGVNLTVDRGAFGTTPTALDAGADKIYRLNTATMTTNAGIVGNAMTVLDTKLSIAKATDSPSGATTGGSDKVIFKFVASASNNAIDAGENKATLTTVDLTVTKSGSTVNDVVIYPSEYDNNATYQTACSALSTTKWRCTMSTVGASNEIVENTFRTYIVRGDVGYSAAGSVEVKIANLGSSSVSTNDVTWSDGTTPQTWVNQSASSIDGGAQTTGASSGTADTTAPTISSFVLANVSTADAVSSTDTITITFSEVIDPTSIAATLVPGGSVSGVLASATGGLTCAGAATTTAVMTLTGITTFDLGTAIADEVSFTTNLALDATGKILTVTLATGTGRVITGQANVAGTTIATVTDANGTAMGTVALTATGSL
ncbi:Ig-like domain-containing protein, partial [Patescibacteria group bacterium]|nr:Ig-like domain-containing protein [Patescibacteria group bacterium]